MSEIILRPDRGKQAYRMRCSFSIGAFPSERSLEKAKYAFAEQFVRDMAKQGWEYLDKYGFELTGPEAPVEVMTLPPRRQQEQWHVASAQMLAAAQAGARPDRLSRNGGYARNVPPVAESEKWEFKLAGVFVREALRVEYPDEHEEKEILEHA